jgi:hypothetical protein
LEAFARDTTELAVEKLGNALECLRDVRTLSDDDDLRLGPPKCKVRVVGDPEIVDAQGRYYHYLGPALLVNLDDRGMVRSLEFVGVEGGMKNKNYIRDVWQYDVKTQKYKFRDLRNMQGVPAHNMRCRDAEAFYGTSWVPPGGPEFFVGDQSWESEREPDAMPPVAFFREFRPDDNTFFVNLRTSTFVRGPPYGLLKDAIEDPARLVKPLIQACSENPLVWMREAAAAITNHQRPEKRGKAALPSRNMQMVQVAQLIFGLTACVTV